MKKLSVLILASILSLSIGSCSDDDDENTSAALTGGEWELVRFTVDGEDSINSLNKCELLETYSFTEDGRFTNRYFELDEDSNECGDVKTFTGTWTEDGEVGGSERFEIIFDVDTNGEEPVTFILGRFTLIYGEEVEQQDGSVKLNEYSYEKNQ